MSSVLRPLFIGLAGLALAAPGLALADARILDGHFAPSATILPLPQ